MIEEAVTIRRQLAQGLPMVFLRDLAGSLNDQSVYLGELGRREEALAAIEEAVTIRRQLVQTRPDAILPNLAISLNNLANMLSQLNRDAEASAIRDEVNATISEFAQLSEERTSNKANVQTSDP